MPPVLAVTDKKGDFSGIITRKWMIRSMVDPSRTKVKKLMRSPPSVELSDSLSKVAKLMIENNVRQLPICDGKKLVGFITDEDIIREAMAHKWGNDKVEDIMTKKPFCLEEDEALGEVLNIFREEGISHLPIVSEAKLKGIISIQDIIEYVYKPKERVGFDAKINDKVKILSIPAKSIMRRPVIIVLPGTRLRNAFKKMQEYNISSLVVVKNQKPVGILTKLDFLEPMAELEIEKQRKFNIQFSIKDVNINEIQRSQMMADFDSFSRRYEDVLDTGTLFVYMKTQGTNYKGDQLIHCRLQLRTRKGYFYSSCESWGIEQTFRMALDKIDKQILRSKELDSDSEYTRQYLRLIDFPLAEV
jgi:CBS domain-containing protein